MTKWPVLVLTVALSGCYIGKYSRPTVRQGGDIALSKPPTVGEVVAKTLLCSGSTTRDTSSVKSQACRAMPPADSNGAPAPIPVRKP